MRRVRLVLEIAVAATVAFAYARAAGPALSPMGAGPEGDLKFDVRDAPDGRAIPCKLTFVGVDGTADPQFTHNDIGRPIGMTGIAAFSRVMSASGSGTVRVPIGTYDVYISRGPEWDVMVERRLRVTADGVVVTARLNHVIDTRGWLSADFHVHAAPSPDSVVPLQHRVIEFAADGVEMIVSTDHNVVSNYQPSIDELGLGEILTSAMGDEITTNGWGHFGAFPLPRNLEQAGHGALLAHGRTATNIFNDVRKTAPGAIIDVHHPRLEDVGYFNLGKFSPHTDRADRSGFSFDFDAVEVLNGYQDPVRRSVDRTIDDWLGLLNHGHLVTATGNSDTHHLTYNMGGYPRNYVRVRDDRPSRVTPAEVAEAVRGHHAFFTTAPFVRVSVGGGGPGDLVAVRGGQARAEVEVQAAPWVSVNRVILYQNGNEVRRWPVAASADVLRFRVAVDLPVAGDGYIVVRVDGDKLLAPVVGDTKTFGVRALALTNPIFLDANGNGRYDPAFKHGRH